MGIKEHAVRWAPWIATADGVRSAWQNVYDFIVAYHPYLTAGSMAVIGWGGYVANGWPTALTLAFAMLVLWQLLVFLRKVQNVGLFGITGAAVAPQPAAVPDATREALPDRHSEIIDRAVRNDLELLKGDLQTSFKRLDNHVAHERQNLRDFEARVVKVLRAWAALDMLRESSEAVSRLMPTLVTPNALLGEASWLAAYAEWESYMRSFYWVCSEWDKTIAAPFDLSLQETDAVRDVPRVGIFEADGIRQRYRRMMVIQSKFLALRDKAINAMKANTMIN